MCKKFIVYGVFFALCCSICLADMGKTLLTQHDASMWVIPTSVSKGKSGFIIPAASTGIIKTNVFMILE